MTLVDYANLVYRGVVEAVDKHPEKTVGELEAKDAYLAGALVALTLLVQTLQEE